MSNPILLDLSHLGPDAAPSDEIHRIMRRVSATGIVLRPDQTASPAPVPLAGLAVSFDLRNPPDAAETAASLKPHATPALLLLVTLTSSDPYDKASTPRAMPAAALCTSSIAATAQTLGMNVTLCPRLATWLEHPEDAVRLAMRVNRRNVGVALDATAWQASDGQAEHLPDVLRLVLPKLNAVTASLPPEAESFRDEPSLSMILPRLAALGWRGPVVLRPAGA